MQRLALFDLDNTLVDQRGAFRAWVSEFAGTHDLAVAALLALETTGPKGPMFAEIHARFGIGASPEELWRQYRNRMPELVSTTVEDREALRRLRSAGWRIGIVTNGMADNQTAKIRRTGLADLVDGWCVSGEAGVRKPERAIFALAAERCGAHLDDGGWMIGDNPADDIAGGRGAGLRTAWVRAAGEKWPAPIPGPDRTVTSAAEATDFMLTGVDSK